MIPIFQTRRATETLGNCEEACIASILELPLRAVPDRLDYIGDPDAWADLVQRTRREGGDEAVGKLEVPGVALWEKALSDWLFERGLGVLTLVLSPRGLTSSAWLKLAVESHRGYWIGIHSLNAEMAHAIVWAGGVPAHDPMGGVPEAGRYGPLIQANLLSAANPGRIARRLGPELLPDVDGRLELHEPGPGNGARVTAPIVGISQIDGAY